MDLITVTTTIDITEILRHLDIDTLTDLYFSCTHMMHALQKREVLSYLCTLYSIPHITTFSQLVFECDSKLLTRRCYHHIGVNTALILASKEGNMPLVHLMLDKGAVAINGAMIKAAKHHHIEPLMLMIERGATDYFRTMVGAIMGEHLDIMKMMTDIGDIHRVHDFQHSGNREVLEFLLQTKIINMGEAMRGACLKGSLDTVKWLLEKGALITPICAINAARGGHLDIISFILDTHPLAVMPITVEAACESGNIQLVHKLLEYIVPNYNNCARIALEDGHLDIFSLMLEKGANDYDTFAKAAATSGNIDIFIEMISKVDTIDYDKCLSKACRYGRLPMVQHILDKGANNYNKGLKNAARGGCLSVVRLMLEKGADNYNEALAEASYNGYLSIVKLMLEKGADNYNECCYMAMRAAGRSYVDIVDLLLTRGHITTDKVKTINTINKLPDITRLIR